MHTDIINKRMLSLDFLIDYMSPLVAIAVGFFSFRHFNFLWKMLFLQVLVYVLVIKIATEISPTLKSGSNHWFYNGYIILEVAFLCFAPYQYFKHSFFKNVLPLLFAFYLSAFCFQVYVNGFDHFANFAFAAAALVITVIYGHMLFLEFRSKKIYWLHSPKIWMCTGLVLYFACNVPFFSFFNYLNENYMKESQFLSNFITNVLANIRYLFLAYAFFLLRKNSLSQQTKFS